MKALTKAKKLFSIRHAWTGGSVPTRDQKKNDVFVELRRLFFREQLAMCGGLDLWVCNGTSPLDRARLFWNQANLDAWSTIRSDSRK
jgi:hypothetical protein